MDAPVVRRRAQRALSRKNLWEYTPWAIKNGVGRVLGVIRPQYLLGKRFRRELAFVSEAQWWPAGRSREYQTAQLRKICQRAYDRTSFYRRMFDDAGFDPRSIQSPTDLAGLPTIDKETLRDHLLEMCTTDPQGRGVDYTSTGGSSGEPLRFYINAERSAIEYAYLVASWGRVGYELRVPQAVFRGQIVPEGRHGLRHIYDPILRRHYYSNFHMTHQNMRAYLDHVATLGPCFLHVYPSSVTTLARHLQHAGRAAPDNVRGILSGSEMVYSKDREQAEKLFKARYFSWYGHSEKLVLASECEHSTDYHVWPTYGYFELLGADGRVVTEPGQRGEITGTGFINTVVPFIRYRTGDFATLGGDRCAQCGREHTILRDVEGRWPRGGLMTSEGSVISMTAFNVHDDTFDNTYGYQFVQAERGKAILRVVPSESFNDADRSLILRRATERLGGQIELTVDVCESLARTRNGKQIRVVSSLVDSTGREQ